MKLVHTDLNQQIRIKQQSGCQWVIESPILFAEYVQALYLQSEGQTGPFVLSKSERMLDFAKAAELIFNPFTINLNDKRILNKLYHELDTLACGETFYLTTQQVLSELQNYFLQLEQSCPYLLTINSEIELTPLWKALGVQLAHESNHFIEMLHLYIQVLAELLNKKLIIFVQIGHYFSLEQRLQLLETAAYHDIALLFIESQEIDFANQIPRYIIDVDGCEI
jgi:CRISPR-associated protein Csn2